MIASPTFKYVLYAFGEIVLVVIGILIALQLNNWNELRKTQNQEIVLLNALNVEFNYNLDELQRVIDINQNNIDGLVAFSARLTPDNQNISGKRNCLALG